MNNISYKETLERARKHDINVCKLAIASEMPGEQELAPTTFETLCDISLGIYLKVGDVDYADITYGVYHIYRNIGDKILELDRWVLLSKIREHNYNDDYNEEEQENE